jgi:hypothetical protein
MSADSAGLMRSSKDGPPEDARGFVGQIRAMDFLSETSLLAGRDE